MSVKIKKAKRVRRVFSAALKKKIVKDIEEGKVGTSSVSREYEVSLSSIYRWLNQYSRHLHKGEVIVVQMQSEAYKTKELEQRVKELEAALGRKQLEIDFLNKLLDVGKEELGIDLKKKSCTPPSTGSEHTKERTPTR